MQKPILTFLVLAVLPIACIRPVSAQTGSYPYGDESDASAKTRTLLHQLAAVEQLLPLEKDRIDHDLPNATGHSTNYMFVRPLLREIYLEGKDALPALVECFDNENYLYHYGGIYSMAAYEIAIVYDGNEAEEIFRKIIDPVPYDLCYAPKIVTRIGADGQEHRGPVFNTSPMTETRESAQQWLQRNAGKSLADIQRETVDFYIREEIKIGFPDEESYQKYLVPLLNLRDNLPHVDERFHNVTVYASLPPATSKSQSQNGQPSPMTVRIPQEPSRY